VKPIIGLVLSDLHIGSSWAMWPRNVKLPGGQKAKLNKGQRYLWRKWENFKQIIPPFHFAVFLGDLIDGQNFKEGGVGQVTSHIPTQHEAFLETVSPLLDDKLLLGGRLFVARGTRYHETLASMDSLAKQLGAEQDEQGWWATPMMALDIGGVKVEAWHKLSGAYIYQAQAMQREIMFNLMAAPDKGYTADLTVVSHWHIYISVETRKQLVVAMPCWELQNPYALERRPNLWIPTLGGVIVQIFPENKKLGKKSIDVECVQYPYPKREMQSIAISVEG